MNDHHDDDSDINFNILKLYELQDKKNTKKQVFLNILKRIHKRIELSSSVSTNLVYEIPMYIIGFPIYNYLESIEFIVTHLQNEGFVVHPTHVIGSIYISWQKDEIQDYVNSIKLPQNNSNNNNFFVQQTSSQKPKSSKSYNSSGKLFKPIL